MVRYYGSYDNAHRGKMRKTGQDPLHPPIIEDEASFIPSRGWAECFVSAKFGPLMIFLKRWFTYNKITQGDMHEYKEETRA